MRVRATKAFSAVRNCQITDLQEGQEVDGDFAVYLLETGSPVESIEDSATTQAATSSEGSSEEPPRKGKGSGADAWIAYARSQGIEVDDDASRDDVIALVDAKKE